MSDPSDQETAVYKVAIKASIETVWNALVKTDDVLPFFFGAVCRTPAGLTPGAPMAMQTKDGKFTSVVGKVLEFSPPHLYSHTLKFTNLDDAPVTVIYDLKETEDGVEFSLTTIGAVPGSKTQASMAQGGPYIVNTLRRIIENGGPGIGGSLMLMLFGLMAPFTPKVCRSENWPFDRIEKL